MADGDESYVSSGDVSSGYDNTDYNNSGGGGTGGGSLPSGKSGDDSSKSGAISKSISRGLQGAAKARQDATDKMVAQNPGVRSYRKGGRVKKTGMIHAHRGEEVVRPEMANDVRKFLKKKTGRETPKDGERMDDPKVTARKGDPKRMGRKEEPERTERKNNPKKTMSRNSPKNMAGKRKHKRMAGRGM